ncbi:MAG: hypothetical protein IIU68_05935 [Bacteroidales bacterium]|nr:hypothetical protein [Bacteroidales bacterium]MBQ5639339.1 hypothetical protein [Bacteroidales bacterium]
MLEEMKLNISKLIALYESERQKADSLAIMLSQKEEEAKKYQEQITDLKIQIDQLKLRSAFVSEGDKGAARERISALIKEIDKCIKLLEG